MDKEEIRQIVLEVLQDQALSSLTCPFHTHTQTDGGQLDASKCLINSPQSTIASVSGTPSSGGAAVLSNSDSQIISDLKNAVNSLILTNKNIGLIKSS